ncbi:MAG: rhomboid family intramembrane serine protease, partial [Bacteroidota bacterium]
MSNFIVNDIKRIFGSGNMISRLILINVIVFLAINLGNFFVILVSPDLGSAESVMMDFLRWIGPDAKLEHSYRLWAFVTYGFVHRGLLHIFFNMLWLYWLGRMLGEYLGDKKLLGAYLLGVIGGAVTYVGVTNLIYLIAPGNGVFVPGSPLIGASAGVMAVIFATATLLPDHTVRLIFIGPVRLKYLALGALILTSLLDLWSNTGGKLAHLGGAAIGYVYVRQL